MAKNEFARRIQKAKDEHYLAGLFGGRQEMGDIIAMVLHDEFGFGPERLKRLHDLVNEKIAEVALLGRQDTKDSEYSIATFEKAVKAAYGQYYTERDERYPR